MPFSDLDDFIAVMQEEELEKKLWDVWLAKPTEQNFEDFKKGVIKDATTTKEEVIKEANEAADEALEMLKGFNPEK